MPSSSSPARWSCCWPARSWRCAPTVHASRGSCCSRCWSPGPSGVLVIDDTRLTYRVFGAPGARRLVVLVGSGMAMALDPLPAETAAYDICVLAIALTDAEILDPGGYGSETPAEHTSDSL